MSHPDGGEGTSASPRRIAVSQAPTAPLPIGAAIVRGFEAWVDCILPLTLIGLLATGIVVAVGAAGWPMVAGLPPIDSWAVDGRLVLSSADSARLFGYGGGLLLIAFLVSGAQRAASTLVVAAHVEPQRGYEGRTWPAIRQGLRDLPKIVATEFFIAAIAMYGAYVLVVPIAAASAGASAAGGGGLAALAVPYLLLLVVGVVLAPAIPAIVLERRGPLGGLERGFRLALPYFFRLFAVLVVAAVVTAVGAFALRLVLGGLLPHGWSADLTSQAIAYVVFGALWMALTAVAFLTMTGVTDLGEQPG